MKQLCVLILVSLMCLSPAGAWGANGHRIVAAIAQRHLTDQARKAIAEILDGESLARVANWGDDVRSVPRWSCLTPFHFVTVPTGGTYPDPEHGTWEDADAVRAVYYLAESLIGSAEDPAEPADALRFLVHVVGDLHQPLHVGRGCDRGGNDLTVSFFGDEVRFHSVWDSGLIESEDLSYTEWVDFLDSGDSAAWDIAPPEQWITEAQALHAEAYRCDVRGDRCPCFCGDCADGFSVFGGCGYPAICTLQVSGPVQLSYSYRARVKPLIEDQLVKGGRRLATLLNAIFSERPSLPASYQALRDELASHPDWKTPLEECFAR